MPVEPPAEAGGDPALEVALVRRAAGPGPRRTTRRTGRPRPGRGCAARSSGAQRVVVELAAGSRCGSAGAAAGSSSSGRISCQSASTSGHLGEEAVAADVEAPAVALDGAADPADDVVGLEHGGRRRRAGASSQAAVSPAGPAPMTTTSSSAAAVMPRRGRRAGRRAVPGTRRSCGSDRRPARPAAPSRAASRARVMSGRRTVGSSSGRGTCTTSLPDPASSQISAASSVIDTSCGLPMLTGPASVERQQRDDALDQVVDVADRAGLAAVAGDRQRFAGQRLRDEGRAPPGRRRGASAGRRC